MAEVGELNCKDASVLAASASGDEVADIIAEILKVSIIISDRTDVGKVLPPGCGPTSASPIELTSMFVTEADSFDDVDSMSETSATDCAVERVSGASKVIAKDTTDAIGSDIGDVPDVVSTSTTIDVDAGDEATSWPLEVLENTPELV